MPKQQVAIQPLTVRPRQPIRNLKKSLPETQQQQRRNNNVWTDTRVELLLNVTLEYKINKTYGNMDWESHQLNADIKALMSSKDRHLVDVFILSNLKTQTNSKVKEAILD